MKVYQRISNLLAAIENCKANGNSEWLEKHESALAEIIDQLPSGSGFDNGTKLDDKSTSEKLMFNTSYHHMDDNGSYCGWSDHTVTVTASLLHGFVLKVSGKDMRGIKEYIEECFESEMSRETQPASVAYETQLRDCLRDFEAMASNEIDYCQTGKHSGEPMRNVIGQWKSLCRDARNILNRETNSYGEKQA